MVEEYLRRRTGQPLNGVLHRGQVRFLCRALGRARPERLLEIAPGPARLTAEIQYDGLGVLIDTSRPMLALARERLKGRPGRWVFAQGDAFSLPFPDSSFDFVYSLKLIRHFRLDDRRRLYGEIRRVLRPGGWFVTDAQNRAVSLPHRQAKGLHRYPIYDVLYDREELVREITDAGFSLLELEGILRRFSWQHRMNRLRHVGLAMPARLGIALLDLLPGGTPSTWMLLAQRG